MNKSQRWLSWLGLLTAVLVMRWWDPLGPVSQAQADTDLAALPPTSTGHTTTLSEMTAFSASAASANPVVWAWPVRETSLAAGPSSGPSNKLVNNPFASRLALTKAAPPPQVQMAAVMPFVGPPLPPPPPPPAPPPPPPPLQVIGTWSDGPSLGAFVSSPNGTLLARPGETLLAEYRVQSVSDQEVVLVQIASQQSWRLKVPAVSSSSYSLAR